MYFEASLIYPAPIRWMQEEMGQYVPCVPRGRSFSRACFKAEVNEPSGVRHNLPPRKAHPWEDLQSPGTAAATGPGSPSAHHVPSAASANICVLLIIT